MLDAVGRAVVLERADQVSGDREPVIKLAQQDEPGIAGQLLRATLDPEGPVEGERECGRVGVTHWVVWAAVVGSVLSTRTYGCCTRPVTAPQGQLVNIAG